LHDHRSPNDPLLSNSLQATQDLSRKLLKHMDQSSRWQTKVLDAIQKNHGQSSQDQNGISPPASLQEHLYMEYEERFRKSLFSHLKYREMENRHERIAPVYTETFEWIFTPPREAQQWSDFPKFLGGDQRLYWITGKPGAGKSTLMKFISEDPRTKNYLETWASGKPLFLSSFYFWCSGTEIQMSLEGFMRTLLHDTLQRFPHLISMVFSDRWEISVVLGDLVTWEEPWTMDETFRAFRLLIQEATKTTKIDLFIDGLDEFHGNYSEQVELIDFIQSLSGLDTKICVSSRPWNVFEDAFKSRPSLKLEDLTYPDMQHYVSSNLSANPGFTALQRLDSEYAARLINNVTTKASGVFLWLVLVVKSLLEGLTDGERLPELQDRLNSLPADLESLFWRILNSVGFERASQLLQIVRGANLPLTVLELSFADEEDPQFLSKMPTVPLTDEQMVSRAELMRRRLNGRCKGLLEAQALPNSEVGYLHRTVKDFIQRPDVGKRLVDGTKPSFNPRMQLLVSQLACFKVTDFGSFRDPKDLLRTTPFWKQFTSLIHQIIQDGPDSPELQAYLLNELDRAAIDINGPLAMHWTSSMLGFPTITSFIHLAVKFQLVSYIKFTLTNSKLADQTELSSLLQLAITEYETFGILYTKNFAFREPNIEIIRILVESGADPNMTITYSSGLTRTLKEYVTDMRLPKEHQILQVLLKHETMATRNDKGWRKKERKEAEEEAAREEAVKRLSELERQIKRRSRWFSCCFSI
jgi:hypothetical protein